MQSPAALRNITKRLLGSPIENLKAVPHVVEVDEFIQILSSHSETIFQASSKTLTKRYAAAIRYAMT